MKEIIRFEGVSQFYPPDLRVFREVHCSFSDGVSCVLGSAGSGKTTLMNLIAGLTSPSQGEVWVLGKNIHRMTPQEAAKVRFEQLGILNATNDFYGELTLLQNILLPFTLRARATPSQHKRAKTLFEQLNIQSLMYSYPRAANSYQLRLAALARALLADPVLLLADEITRGLSLTQSSAFLQTLTSVCSGKSLILLTSDPASASIAQNHYQISDGNIMEVTQ